MKFFKTVDEKLNDIGFAKLKENKYGVDYVREVRKYGYNQVLSINHKASADHLVQSYQDGVNSDGFNNVVGLTAIEMKLAYKKLKQLKRKYKW